MKFLIQTNIRKRMENKKPFYDKDDDRLDWLTKLVGSIEGWSNKSQTVSYKRNTQCSPYDIGLQIFPISRHSYSSNGCPARRLLTPT